MFEGVFGGFDVVFEKGGHHFFFVHGEQDDEFTERVQGHFRARFDHVDQLIILTPVSQGLSVCRSNT